MKIDIYYFNQTDGFLSNCSIYTIREVIIKIFAITFDIFYADIKKKNFSSFWIHSLQILPGKCPKISFLVPDLSLIHRTLYSTHNVRSRFHTEGLQNRKNSDIMIWFIFLSEKSIKIGQHSRVQTVQ